MKKQQFVIIGLGRFGSSLALQLMEMGCEVLGIDRDEDVVEEMSEQLTHVVVGDATDEQLLRSIGVRNMECGIVAIGDDIQMSILATILLKEMGIETVVAKAISRLHGRALEKLGVDRIVYPERDMGIRVAHQLVAPNLLDYLQLSKEYTIAELSVPACLNGKTLSELNTHTRFGCSIVAIHTNNGVLIAPTSMDKVHCDDIMVIIGTNDNIGRFEEEMVDGM